MQFSVQITHTKKIDANEVAVPLAICEDQSKQTQAGKHAFKLPSSLKEPSSSRPNTSLADWDLSQINGQATLRRLVDFVAAPGSSEALIGELLGKGRWGLLELQS